MQEIKTPSPTIQPPRPDHLESEMYTVEDVAEFAVFFAQAYEVVNGFLMFRFSYNITRISNLTPKEVFYFWYQHIKEH
jgi:hypothetical protein